MSTPIRAAMRDPVGHSLEEGDVGPTAVEMVDTSYATHGIKPRRIEIGKT
jgi:hypothetical protein